MNIVYLGASGFPFGLAAVERQLLISKALVSAGCKVTIVCGKGVHNSNKTPNLSSKGIFDGINYVYTSGSPYRASNFFYRNYQKFIRYFLEFLQLIKINKIDKIDFIIVSNRNLFFESILYNIFCYILKSKIVLNFVEFYDWKDKKRSRTLKRNINDYLFFHYSNKLYHGYIVISHFLDEIVKKKYNSKSLIVPVLVDLEEFDESECSSGKGEYLLYCGSADYLELIKFIISSFLKASVDDIKLFLIVNGNDNNISLIRNFIKDNFAEDKIRILQNLTRKELINKYKSATGLLIPLMDTIQDRARFPHKIGEYLTSGNPVITTNVGEIQHYLKNNVNAIIADSFDTVSFSNKIDRLLKMDKVEKETIGRNGRFVAESKFNYHIYSSPILEFLKKL